MQVRQTRCPSRGLARRTCRWQRGQEGRTIPVMPAASSRSISRRTAGMGARCPWPVSRSGSASRTQASFCWWEGRGAERRAAAAITSGPAPVSRARTRCWTTAMGSRSASGHLAHRGRPARSREAIRRTFPQAAQGSGCGPQTEQYQSWPRRWRVRNGLPHPAQHGGETVRAPAFRNAMSRSPTARGAGDRPSASTAGCSARAAARRRDFARPPATPVTAARTWPCSSRCSTAVTRSTISPTGSETARPTCPAAVTAVRHR